MKAVKAPAYHVEVGVFGDARREGEAATNAEIALVHEYGSPSRGIPERSFLRASIDLHRADYRAFLAAAARKLLDKGSSDMQQVFELLGLKAAADVKNLMRLPGYFVPNTPETMRRKGSSQPLIDTGQLISSVGFRVVKGR